MCHCPRHRVSHHILLHKCIWKNSHEGSSIKQPLCKTSIRLLLQRGRANIRNGVVAWINFFGDFDDLTLCDIDVLDHDPPICRLFKVGEQGHNALSDSWKASCADNYVSTRPLAQPSCHWHLRGCLWKDTSLAKGRWKEMYRRKMALPRLFVWGIAGPESWVLMTHRSYNQQAWPRHVPGIYGSRSHGLGLWPQTIWTSKDFRELLDLIASAAQIPSYLSTNLITSFPAISDYESKFSVLVLIIHQLSHV